MTIQRASAQLSPISLLAALCLQALPKVGYPCPVGFNPADFVIFIMQTDIRMHWSQLSADSQMWSFSTACSEAKNDGLKSQEPRTKTDELIWIWTQEQIEACFLLLPCGESLWNIEMTCQGMPHRNSDSGLSSSNTFASCQIQLIRSSGDLMWNFTIANKQVFDQGSVTEEHELCRRNCGLLCQCSSKA